MLILFLVLVILAAVIMALFILVQNPKGGGLTGNIAGFSSQFMGVKQTTDVLEKGTWLFAAIIGILCLVSSFFLAGSNTVEDRTNDIGTPTQQAPSKPAGNTPIQP